MKQDFLKPYVFKVEGAANFALYNVITGGFYRFSTDGSVEELRKTLLEEGLIFQSEGIVPSKIMQLDLMKLKDSLFLRELQIRLNGRGEDNCWNRKKNKGKKKSMSISILRRLKETCQYIPIQKIRLEAEIYEKDKIETILREFNFGIIELYVEKGLEPKEQEHLKNTYGNKGVTFIEDGRKKIKEQIINVFHFLYSQYFNPCLGHKVAVDANGDIKCCLWFEKVLGNIEKADIKEMIIKGDFDTYWDTHKTKINSCKDCELRRVCDDCRHDVLQKGGAFYDKPFYCEYDPYTGD